MRSLRPLLLAAACGALLTACKKPMPPPAAAAEPIAIDGVHARIANADYLEYRVGTHIDAPAEVVWGVLTDAAGYPSWNSTVAGIEGTIALDEEIDLSVHIAPDRTFGLTVSTFEPTSRMVWEDGNNMFRGVRTFTLSEVDGGTDFTMAEVMTGSMLDKIVPKLPEFGPDFDAFAAGLKAEAEARYTPPAPSPAEPSTEEDSEASEDAEDAPSEEPEASEAPVEGASGTP